MPRVHQTTFDGPPSDGVVVAGEGVRFGHQAAVPGRLEERRHEHDRLDRLDAGQACDVLVQGPTAQLGDEEVRVTAEVPGVAVGRGVGAAGAGGEAQGEAADHADQDGRGPEPGPVPAHPPANAQRRRRHASTVRCRRAPGNGGSHTPTVGVPAAASPPSRMRLLAVDPHHPPALRRRADLGEPGLLEDLHRADVDLAPGDLRPGSVTIG